MHARRRPRAGVWAGTIRCRPLALPALALAAALSGCGAPATAPAVRIPGTLLREMRPIGAGERFRPPVRGTADGPCTRTLGARYPVHVEVFAADRVVLVPAGIGVRRRGGAGAAGSTRGPCYGELVTLEPTGVVLVRQRSRATLASLFAAWGQPLSSRRIASFAAPHGTHVRVFVDGSAWRGTPAGVPLRMRAEIVLELGPFVPPHVSYAFPPGA